MSSRNGGLFRPFLSLCITLLLLLLPSEAYQDLSDASLKSLPRPDNDFDIHNGALLSPILIPRVSGTAGSTAVLNHFVNFIRTTLPDWNIQFQNSTSTTPVSNGKEVPFINLIASRDPPWAAPGDVSRLTIVAHYDSKYTPEGFIGATDSAAPCAIMMHAMRSIDSALTEKWKAMKAEGHAHALEEQRGIQFLFLDGEEAFAQWTDTDSLYGARSLAEQWDAEMHPVMSTFKTPLSSISLFVLLDLLGAKDPGIQSYFPTTHWAYLKLANLEKRLRDLKQFKSSNEATGTPWFLDVAKTEDKIPMGFAIEDDHIPFLRRGVEILHVIDASPSRGFPVVWHNMKGIPDDGEHLDLDTVEDWGTLITAFAAEWMELEGFMPSATNKDPSMQDTGTKRSMHGSKQPNKKTEL
ncbi:conserved hypothetical protein [Aspergillus terreus NIH2624]|uniref:Peptide hydrolase n=1 Tax=Aspergillus terreus (strain NIH 2624 / FGSC A1156) TaxID=341663 RepID=Q0CLR5_ASPTN|nr:uncharacterized protein ATEG_05369 [Aspergillus terreus NIH2624]EAU34438.1 conserved hypothetical protein [Aspergillus terreus NIH2624]